MGKGAVAAVETLGRQPRYLESVCSVQQRGQKGHDVLPIAARRVYKF